MQTSLAIHCATSGEVALIERLIIDIANFHGDTNTDNPTAIMRNLFGPTSSVQSSSGEDDNQPVAFAICFTEYGAHRSQRALHLHLFCIVETHRRKGAAKQILAYLNRMALE